MISGYATEGSHFIVKDQNGNILQEFNSNVFDSSGITPFSVMALGEVRPFILSLDQPLEEGLKLLSLQIKIIFQAIHNILLQTILQQYF